MPLFILTCKSEPGKDPLATGGGHTSIMIDFPHDLSKRKQIKDPVAFTAIISTKAAYPGGGSDYQQGGKKNPRGS
jgi:hypothetical protein